MSKTNPNDKSSNKKLIFVKVILFVFAPIVSSSLLLSVFLLGKNIASDLILIVARHMFKITKKIYLNIAIRHVYSIVFVSSILFLSIMIMISVIGALCFLFGKHSRKKLFIYNFIKFISLMILHLLGIFSVILAVLGAILNTITSKTSTVNICLTHFGLSPVSFFFSVAFFTCVSLIIGYILLSIHNKIYMQTKLQIFENGKQEIESISNNNNNIASIIKDNRLKLSHLTHIWINKLYDNF